MNNNLAATIAGLLCTGAVGTGVHFSSVNDANAATKDTGSITSTAIRAVFLRTAAYTPPKTVQGIYLAGDSPAQMWFFPSNPAEVMLKVFTWLNGSTPTQVSVPTLKDNVVFHAYLGPAQLFFTDEFGRRVTVYPTYYIAPTEINGQKGYRVKYFPDVITYEYGPNKLYLHSPSLYRWLTQDRWQSEFQMESYTDLEHQAILAVFHSKIGGSVHKLFPTIPSVTAVQIPRGGPLVKGKAATVPGTCTTMVDQKDANVEVTFSEAWDNGKSEHIWRFLVSPKGAILTHSESGDIPPQQWR